MNVKECVLKKQYLYILVLNLIFIGAISAHTINTIAIVNISNVFQQIPQRSLVAQQLANEFKDRATELKLMEHDLKIQIQRLQRDGSTMKASVRSDLEKSVIKKRAIFSDKAQAFERDNRFRENEERNKILMRIQKAVKNISLKNGYDIVIDTSVIAYAGNVKDITNDVLEQVK